MLEDADREPADEVHERDHHAGHRLAADEAARSVHAREEVGLPLQVEPEPAGLLARDRPRLHLGVDRHLAARKTVEREPGGDLAGARRPGRDHDELHDRDDREDDATDHEVVGGDVIPERGDDEARRVRAVDRCPRQDEPCGRDVQDEPHERRAEEERRKDAQLQGRPCRDRAEQREHRHGQVRGEQQIDDRRGHRCEHDEHGQQDRRRQRVVGDAGDGRTGGVRAGGMVHGAWITGRQGRGLGGEGRDSSDGSRRGPDRRRWG